MYDQSNDPVCRQSSNVKHTMHGVSHVRPEEEDMYQTPPPTHYGVGEAIKARNTTAEIHEVIRARGAAITESNHHSKINRNGFITMCS